MPSSVSVSQYECRHRRPLRIPVASSIVREANGTKNSLGLSSCPGGGRSCSSHSTTIANTAVIAASTPTDKRPRFALESASIAAFSPAWNHAKKAGPSPSSRRPATQMTAATSVRILNRGSCSESSTSTLFV